MGQKRVASLAVLLTESQLLRDIDFSSITNIFAGDKDASAFEFRTESFLIVIYTAKNNVISLPAVEILKAQFPHQEFSWKYSIICSVILSLFYIL